MKTFAFLSHLDINLYLFRAPIIRVLILRGYKVYAICPKGDKNEALKELGCEVVNYEIERKSLNPFRELKAIENIYYAIKDLDIDILHTFTAKPNIYGTFAAKRAKIPVVLNLVEGLGSFYTKDSFKYKIIRFIMESLYKRAFHLSDGVVFVNKDDPKYMLKKGLIAENKIKIIKSVGIDTEKFSISHYDDEKLLNIKKSLGLKNKTIVLMVARAIWDKGIKEFYEAAKLLKKSHPDVVFLHVGGVDEGNPSSVSEEFLEKGAALWLGHRDDIVDLTAICDLYVLPSSYKEGLPVTLLEAASMSKPIITTDTTGCRDVVSDGVNGFLVPVKNTELLKEKIILILENKKLREDMQKESRNKAVREFEVEKVIKQYMEYYETFF